MRWKQALIGCLFAVCGGIVPTLAATTQEPSANTKSAVVMIALFDSSGNFTGWGSGFFVDERIIVTNKHVINDGLYYRVYATGTDDSVDLTCFRNLTRSDVKINLDDDVAYMRATLTCPHGSMYFADTDPKAGDAVSILGYPFKGTLKDSLQQSRTTGTVLGTDGTGTWLATSAFVDFGNSGGPVVSNDKVEGVVVAKSVDDQGNFIQGLFIPASQVLRGLTYANNSTFGYTPQDEQNNAAYQSQTPQHTGPMTDSDCSLLLGEGGRAADNGQCKCITGYQRDATGLACVRTSGSSSSASSVSSVVSSSSSKSASSSSRSMMTLTLLQVRTCARVRREFTGSAFVRVNARLIKRLGFGC